MTVFRVSPRISQPQSILSRSVTLGERRVSLARQRKLLRRGFKRGSSQESSVEDYLGRSPESNGGLVFRSPLRRNELCLRSVGFGMDVPFHLACPFKKAPEIASFPPHEFPKLQEADLRHLDSAIGLDAPQEVRTPPRRQPVAFGRVPEKTDRVAHDDVTGTPS